MLRPAAISPGCGFALCTVAELRGRATSPRLRLPSVKGFPLPLRPADPGASNPPTPGEAAMATQFFRQSDGSFEPVRESLQPTVALGYASDAEAGRRRNLAVSDELLNEIEELRLVDRHALSPQLRSRLQSLYLAVIGKSSDRTLKNLSAAHDFVLAVQHPLMAANPRISMSSSQGQRAPGQPFTVTISVGGSWKLLTLPAVTEAGLTDEWFALVVATLERAWDRWAYAQYHAITAARRHSRHTRQAVARAVVAWSNYWQLLEEVDRLRGLPKSPAG